MFEKPEHEIMLLRVESVLKQSKRLYIQCSKIKISSMRLCFDTLIIPIVNLMVTY